ncbi:leukotriene B4 receptor 1-like [Heptranchias perlo]|uniref:leukotriene B4 receptor 1-like n=1 Tax=Heptranchias perlo TaxID=212740 RepID=UPI0035595C70
MDNAEQLTGECISSNSTLDNLLSSKASTVIGSLILTLAFVVGLPGNAFVVWTLLFRVRRRTVTCVLVLNLAVADGVTLLTTPFWIHFLVREDWPFGRGLCKAFHYLCCLNMYASIFLIALMSLDRFVAVARPFTAARLRRKGVVLKALAGLWALAALIALLAPYYREVRTGRIECRRLCEAVHNTTSDAIVHYATETVVGFLAPLVVVTVSYAAVGRRVRALRSRQRSRTERLIVAVVVAFSLFWLPYHVVNVMQVGAELAGAQRLLGLVKEQRPMVTALAFVGCSVNPILYAFTGVQLIRSTGPNFMAKLFEVTTTVEGGPAGQSQSQNRAARRDTTAGRNDSACLDQLTGL